MRNDRPNSSETVELASKLADALVAAVAVICKNITASGAANVPAVGPIQGFTVFKDEKLSPTSEVSAFERKTEEAVAPEYVLKSQFAALESHLVAIRRELDQVRIWVEKARSELASQVRTLQAEKKPLTSNLERARYQASNVAAPEGEAMSSDQGQEKVLEGPAEEKVASSTEAVAARPSEGVIIEIEDQQSQPLTTDTKAARPLDVTLEEVESSVFPREVDRVIFMRALSDTASQDTATRADAARAMAGIRHELSVRTLVAQMAHEPSAQVRQECIKALATLEMKEGLPAIKRALTDQAGSVRLAAVWALYHLAGTESVPALIHMFSDESKEVRRRAITCIDWLGRKEAPVEAMGGLRSHQVVSALIGRLNEPEKSIRNAVLGALETITGKRMSESFPADEEQHEALIKRWQKWWTKELLG